MKNLLTILKMKPLQLMRHHEPIFQENFKDLILTDNEWIDVMLQYPILIERPIVVKNGQAVIGRPIENIIKLLQEF
ncbi:Arsenate reductase [compost metagenome]